MRNIINFFKLFDIKFKKKFYKIQFYTLLITIGNTLAIYLYGLVAFFFTNSENLINYKYFNLIADIFKIENIQILFIYFLIFVIIYSFLIALLNFFVMKKINYFANELAANIQQRVFKYYIWLEYSFFIRKGFNLKISELLVDTQKMYSLVSSILQSFFHFYNFIFTFILLIFISVEVAIINIVFLASIYFGIYSKFKKIFTKNSEVFSNVSANIIEIFNNSLQGIKAVKIYKLENLNLKKISELNKILTRSRAFIQTLIISPRLFVESMFLFLLLVIILLNTQLNVVEDLFFILTIFTISFAKLVPCFQNFYTLLSTIKDTSESYKKINSILMELDNNRNNLNYENGLEQDQIEMDKIEIKNVFFKHNDKIIFKNFNFTINKNDKVFINGPSGSGKSTLMDIIAGFIKPNEGKIFLNGKNNDCLYKKINLKYLSQDSFLFKGSILENITLQTKIDKNELEKLKRIISKLYLNDLINDELDLEKDSGDFANKISGGQKQRILLARALYFTPDLLILDESLNAIDPEKKFKILDYLVSNKEFTLLYISHDSEFNNKFNKKLNILNKNNN